MLVCFILLYFLLIFPIFVNFKVIYVKEDKKIYYLISLFNKVNVLGGYITFTLKELAIHLSSTKVMLIPYINLLGFNKKLKSFNDFKIFSVEILFENAIKSNENNFIINFYAELIYKIIRFNIKRFNGNFIFNFINKANNDINRSEIYIKNCATFNLITILILLIKTLMEKIIYEYDRSKQDKRRLKNGV